MTQLRGKKASKDLQEKGAKNEQAYEKNE